MKPCPHRVFSLPCSLPKGHSGRHKPGRVSLKVRQSQRCAFKIAESVTFSLKEAVEPPLSTTLPLDFSQSPL